MVDTIDSVCAYEKGNFCLVLVDDESVGRNLVEKIAPQVGGSAVSILNPRRGRGIGWGAALQLVSLVPSKKYRTGKISISS